MRMELSQSDVMMVQSG
ncbi:unnamed protein product [Tuber melanosporum]|uniref:(Perigord truffle) hypothetical protein n=1 Tax=Tuber melanosporum (strain Mel28) TaxID=656061 RepID=D5G4C6_TUBMM|nr:unnamed protein product [Tuber melanosporum]